jgi:hypothetical protein
MATLLVRGGRVIDPSQGVDRVDDVLVRDGLVVAVGHAGTQPVGRFLESMSRNKIEQLIENRRLVSHGSKPPWLLAFSEPNNKGALSSRLDFQMFTGHQ